MKMLFFFGWLSFSLVYGEDFSKESLLNEWMDSQYVGAKIESLDIDVFRTSPETEARWMYALDQSMALITKRNMHDSYEGALKHVKTDIMDNRDDCHLFYSTLNKGIVYKGMKYIVNDCYFVVDIKTNKIISYKIVSKELIKRPLSGKGVTDQTQGQPESADENR